jgi:L-seryl-tRNA(Ser) seleniumtransferase
MNFDKLPAVHQLLDVLTSQFPQIYPAYLKQMIHDILQKFRSESHSAQLTNHSKDTIFNAALSDVKKEINQLLSGSLKKAINATGVVLHTGLGRAPISPQAMKKAMEISRYSTLEIDLKSGKRGQRNNHLAKLLRLITGAESGLAVNNNAAAVMLALNSLAQEKEVILSRGEMVEIGGSFRLPEVMKMSGVILKEVGTTNKTHLSDYENAINENTGAILLCHTSNYEVHGFTAKPKISSIVALANRKSIPVIYDLGSGSLIASKLFGQESEPEIRNIVKENLDLITFSGDKLLGGPQAGVIIGKNKYTSKCLSNHLLRAIRLDKIMLKLLQETLISYLKKDVIKNNIALNMLTTDIDLHEQRTERFFKQLETNVKKHAAIVKTFGKVGSGAFPTYQAPTVAIQFQFPNLTPAKLANMLRAKETPVIAYIANDALHIDLKTVGIDEEPYLLAALNSFS